MVEIRLAKKGEEARQKEIWKRCFGDEDTYIDFYFTHKYNQEETALLLEGGQIAAMTTMIPARLITPDGRDLDTAMVYAVATHPAYQARGYSTQIMDFCQSYLQGQGVGLSILVPASQSLFDFYAKRGYEKAFYHRQVTLTYDQILAFNITNASKVCAKELGATSYNHRRRDLLKGSFYVDYCDDELAYQKKVSKRFGADLYGLSSGPTYGCAVIERISESKLLIKEILMPEALIQPALDKIAHLFPADEYIIRMPAYLGEGLGGVIKPFGMIKSNWGTLREIIGETMCNQLAYLGIAHD